MTARFLHEIFERQAGRRPDAAALIGRESVVTYRDLDAAANRLAHHLRGRNVGPGTRLGLFMHRGELPIVAILAVLKAGAAYVPVDPVHPPERIRGILDDAGVGLVLTESVLADAVPPGPGRTVIVGDDDRVRAAVAGEPSTRIDAAGTGLTPADLCYIIFTSGSTGRPKGIMTEHRNVVAFVAAFRETCGLGETDRVYQGFSLGFDGSVEEIWMAFASGAALVVGPPELASLGDETARYMAERGVTFFSTVPTFLGMIHEDVPSLRLIVVSGEQCPPELVRRWVRPGRRMLNVYGPTETTVNATAWECRPGDAVKIGRALPGYRLHILDETRQPVPAGQPGELYIGGAGVARGYLNQPDLTHRHFVPDPFNGTAALDLLYRTGDLVQQDDQGELAFLGRIDGQVKVRGYRIELAEIEAALGGDPAITLAAVTVVRRDGLSELAAYVVPEPAAAGALDREAVLARLRESLPSYMIPTYLEVMADLPQLASGKIDRSRLPEAVTPFVAAAGEHVAPRTDLERRIAGVWESLFETSPISVTADFFRDLRGYSLLAARLVSRLRAEHGLEVALREVYAHPTVAGLARCVGARTGGASAAKVAEPAPSGRDVFAALRRRERWACLALQALAIPLLYALMAVPVLAALALCLAMARGGLASGTGVGLLVAITAFWYPCGLLVSIASKWLIVGRFRPGRHRLWGLGFCRLWLVERIHALSGAGLLAGTPLLGLYYRLMGARIGRGVILDTPLCTAFDLVSVGDESCVGAETQLLGYRIEDGWLVLGRVEIGRRCFVGIHSCLGLDVQLEDDARLGDLSLLTDGRTVPAGASYRGSPAEAGAVPVPEPGTDDPAPRPLAWGLAHLGLISALGVFLLLTILPGLAVVWPAFVRGGPVWGLASVPLAVLLGTLAYCLLVAGLKAVVLRRTPPGTCPVHSGFFLRKWFVDLLIAVSRSTMHAVYTTIYLPPWLRLMGARIGRLAEISTVSQTTPDLIDIGDGSFFADGAMIGGRRFHRGRAQFLRNRIGRRSFVGNNAILPLGRNLGAGCLLGVLSTPPEARETTPDGTEWLGSPSFPLPHRVKVEGFDESVTYAPTRSLYAQRFVIDAIRILVPGLLAGYGGLALFAYLDWGWTRLGLAGACLLAPAVVAAISAAAALAVAGLKWVLMGRFAPVIKPLWSRYVWWNEVINGAYETAAVPALAPLLGTPFFNGYLRLLGCRIGRHAYLGTTLFSEFDLVDIGDFAILNAGVVVQNHLFEDRIMKSSHLHIGDECTVGNMAVVLYDTEMKPGSVVGPLSLLMKGETLPPRTRWVGIPTRRAPDREGG